MHLATKPDLRLKAATAVRAVCEFLVWGIGSFSLAMIASFAPTNGLSGLILDAAANAIGPALWNLLGWLGLIVAVVALSVKSAVLIGVARQMIIAAYGVGMIAFGVLIAIAFSCVSWTSLPASEAFRGAAGMVLFSVWLLGLSIGLAHVAEILGRRGQEALAAAEILTGLRARVFAIALVAGLIFLPWLTPNPQGTVDDTRDGLVCLRR